MSKFQMTPAWLVPLLLLLASCAASPGPPAPQAQTAALAPGMARVWCLRQANPPSREVEAARPMIFANGGPLAETAEGTVFFHDFGRALTGLRSRPMERRLAAATLSDW